MSASLRAQLEALIVEYARSNVDWERSLATRFGAVPLYADAGGCVLLSPGGEWIFVHSDQDWVATVEYSKDVSEEWKQVAIASAVKRHPALRGLLGTAASS